MTRDRPHTSSSSVASTFDEVESLCLSKSSSSVDSSQCYQQCQSLDLANYNPFSVSTFSFQQHDSHLPYDKAADFYRDVGYEDMDNFHGINNEKIKDTDKLFRKVLGLKHNAKGIRRKNPKDVRNSLSDLSESSASQRDSDRGRDLIIPDEEEEEYPFSKYRFNRRPDRENLVRLGRSASIQSTGSGRFSDIVYSLTDGTLSKYNTAGCASSFSSDQSIYWDVKTPSISSHILSNTSSSSAGPQEVIKQRSFSTEPSVLPPTTPPESVMPFTPYTAERMLSELGFSGSDSFIPERFLKDWYNKLIKSDLDYQNTTQLISDGSPKVSPTSQNRYPIFNEHDYHKSSETGSPSIYDSSVHPPRPGLVGREHFEHLRECLERVAAQPHAADIPPSKKRKQWATSKQQSLPLCLETLSENDEEQVRLNTAQHTQKKYKDFHKRKHDSIFSSCSEGPNSSGYQDYIKYVNQLSSSDCKGFLQGDSIAPNKAASHPHLAAGCDKQDSLMSKSSIEVADIMQSSWYTKPAVSKLVEPAMISIVLHDVDGNVTKDRLLEPSSSLTLTQSVDQCPDLLNISTSRSPSMSASPVPISPVTVIEVGLDNANDSLDMDEGDHFLTLNDITERRHSTGGLQKKQEQTKTLKSHKRRSSLMTRKEISDSHIIHDSFEDVNSNFTHDLFKLKPGTACSSNTDYLSTRDALVQADDGRLSPIIEFAIDDIFIYGEADNGNDYNNDIFYLTVDCSTQCDLPLDSTFNANCLLSKPQIAPILDKCVQANRNCDSERVCLNSSSQTCEESSHIDRSTQTESLESVSVCFNDKLVASTTLTSEHKHDPHLPLIQTDLFSKSTTDTVDSVVNLLSLQRCPVSDMYCSGVIDKDQFVCSVRRQTSLDRVVDIIKTSTPSAQPVQHAEGQCHLSSSDPKQEFKQRFLLGRLSSFDSNQHTNSQPAADRNESKSVTVTVSALTEPLTQCLEVEMLTHVPQSCDEDPLPKDTVFINTTTESPDCISSSITDSDIHPSVWNYNSQHRTVHVAHVGSVTKTYLLTVPQGSHSKDKATSTTSNVNTTPFLSVSGYARGITDTSSNVEDKFDFFFTKMDEASGSISPDPSVEVESLFSSLSTDDTSCHVHSSQLSVCNMSTNRPHSPLPRQLPEDDGSSFVSVSSHLPTGRRISHGDSTEQWSEYSPFVSDGIVLKKSLIGDGIAQTESLNIVLNHPIKEIQYSEDESSNIHLPSGEQDSRCRTHSPYVVVLSESKEEQQDLLLNEQSTTYHELTSIQLAKQDVSTKCHLLSVSSPAGSKPASPLHSSDPDSDFDELNCFDSSNQTCVDNRPPLPRIIIKNDSDEVNLAHHSVNISQNASEVVTNHVYSVLMKNSSAYFKPVESPLYCCPGGEENLYCEKEHVKNTDSLTVGCSVPGGGRTRSASCEPVIRVPIPVKRYSVPLFGPSDDNNLNTVSLVPSKPCTFLSKNSSFRLASKNKASCFSSPCLFKYQSTEAASQCNSFALDRSTSEDYDETCVRNKDGIDENSSEGKHCNNQDALALISTQQANNVEESQRNNAINGSVENNIPSMKYSETSDIYLESSSVQNEELQYRDDSWQLDIDRHSILTSKSTQEMHNHVTNKPKSMQVNTNVCFSGNKELFKRYSLSSNTNHQLISLPTEEPQHEPGYLVDFPRPLQKGDQTDKTQYSDGPVSDMFFKNVGKTLHISQTDNQADGLAKLKYTQDRTVHVLDTQPLGGDPYASHNNSGCVSTPGNNGKRFKSSLTLFISENGKLKPVMVHRDQNANNSITVLVDGVHIQDLSETSRIRSDDNNREEHFKPMNSSSHLSDSMEYMFDKNVHQAETCTIKTSCDFPDKPAAEHTRESSYEMQCIEDNENIQNPLEELVKTSNEFHILKNAKYLHGCRTQHRKQYSIASHVDEDPAVKEMTMYSTQTKSEADNHLAKTTNVSCVLETEKHFNHYTRQQIQSCNSQGPQYNEENLFSVKKNSSNPILHSVPHAQGVMAGHYSTKYNIPHNDWVGWHQSGSCNIKDQEPYVPRNSHLSDSRVGSPPEESIHTATLVKAEGCKINTCNWSTSKHQFRKSREMPLLSSPDYQCKINGDHSGKKLDFVSVSEDRFKKQKDVLTASEEDQNRSDMEDLIIDSQSSSVDISEIFENSKLYLASDSTDVCVTKHTREKRNPAVDSDEVSTFLQCYDVNIHRSQQKSPNVLAMKERFENSILDNSVYTCVGKRDQTNLVAGLKTVSVKNITHKFEQNPM